MTRDRSLDVAVVGVAGWFPGRRDVEGLWSAVRRGERLTTTHSREALLDAGVPADLVDDPDYVPVAGHLPDADRFAHTLFRITTRDAEVMDPQHRLMLQAAWAGLEDAASAFGRDVPVTSVFASTSGSGYLRAILTRGPLDPARLDQALHGNEPDFIASLIAYKLGLNGAAIAVQTACSSGLVAVHLAVQALLNGECDQAVVVAAGIGYPQGGYLYLPGGVLSRTGVCRPFDEAADGVVPGAGVACVVLRRLADALSEGPPPHGVIVGSAVNNDGAARAGYFAPSLGGQENVIRAAYAAAGIDATHTGYLETHGTGTPVGDPIEWSAASTALSGLGAAPGAVAVGALKANIGHTDAAAGVAGLIKALRVVREATVLPVAGFRRLNPLLENDGSPLYVPRAPGPWTGPGTRRASVSSFGIGGTNAHAVIEQAPAPSRPPRPSSAPRLLALSAMDARSLRGAARRLSEHLSTTEVPIEDVAHTLVRGRAELPVRMVTVAEDRTGAATALTTELGRAAERTPSADPAPLVFLFPGQGAQRPGMALPFAEALPGYRTRLQRCVDAFGEPIADRLRRVLFDPSTPADDLRDTGLAQPALFAMEYALARTLVDDLGLVPAAVAGHSLGEVTAACVAGMLDVATAAAFVAARAQAMRSCPPGGMLWLGCDERTATALVEKLALPLELAAVNGPAMCVVAGPSAAVTELRTAIGAEIRSGVLRTSHAFHSVLMTPAVRTLATALPPGDLPPSRLALASGFTGTLLAAGTRLPADALVEQIRRPVLFAEALGSLLGHFGPVTAVEVGPGAALTAMAQYSGMAAIPLDGPRDGVACGPLGAVGALWVEGHPVRLANLTGGGSAIHLPGYHFAGERFLAPELAAPAPLDGRRPDRRPGAAPVVPISPEPDTGRGGKLDPGALLRGLWSDLLGAQDHPGTADFFDLGGDSMLVTHLARGIRAATGVTLPLRGLLAARTLDGHIALLTESLNRRVD
ncbi:acyltransferase domain-containing protein [Micromonospora sp. KC606]|uniref:type I polyketide synthase n=1 Tax=Micromonospora sp. KC606 TaxID=2530379 RepID=UPI00104DA660|nr:type I polyketide synthase [Micromonospora sp. KC606]TDC85499.1 acyltransferase domain-containing protein [Micromonospora sp. KC606]